MVRVLRRPLAAAVATAFLASSPPAHAQDWASPAAEGSSPPAPPAAPPSAAVAAPHDTAIMVHVASPRPVDLQLASAGAWVPICTSPCDRPLPEHAWYRAAGDGNRPSPTFALARGSDARTNVVVDPSSSAWHSAGVALTAGGFLAMGVGSSLLLLVAPARGLADFGHGGDSSAWATGGAVTLLAGVVMVFVGLAALLATPPSHVSGGVSFPP